MNIIDKLEDIGLVERCYDCNHVSFHPIWWIKNLFKKHKKYVPNKYGEISKLQSTYIMQAILDATRPMILEKFSQINTLPKNTSNTIKFRRYKNNETLD